MSGGRRILGIDPGTRVAGWGVVELSGNASRLIEFGAIRTKGPELGARLMEVHRGLRAVIERLEPDAVAVERPFVGRNASTAMAIGMARAVALLVAAEHGVEVTEYPPAQVKRAVVGNGSAAKQQVAAMVRVILGLPQVPEPADAADALAVALTHVHRTRLAV